MTPEISSSAPRAGAAIPPEVAERVVARLLELHGTAQEARIRRGVAQVAARWWEQDGDAGDFAAFCEEHFLADGSALDQSFARLETVMEQVEGHLHEVRRELLMPLDVNAGPAAPVTAVDRLLVRLDLGAHVDDDLFQCRTALFALLNFPLHSLQERLAEGPGWDRAAWARSRMMERFASRVPAAALHAVTAASTAAEEYVGAYNIRVDRLLTPRGERPFPEGLRLISHWGLRDELAAAYTDPDRAAALVRQRLIFRVMERIVRQEIPAAVIDNPGLLWEPESNTVRPFAAGQARAAGAAAEPAGPADPADLADPAKTRSNGAVPAVETPRPPASTAAGLAHPADPAEAVAMEREPDRRYAHLRAIYRAHRGVDPYTPTAPSLLARRFERDRQMPEAEVEALLVAVLEAPEVDGLARRIERRLGRPLLPFDIWYSGFKSRRHHGQAELDARVRAVYPTVAAFQEGLPRLLARLGFAPERAEWLAARIVVDPARGAGHATGAVRREDRAHLRTRVSEGGMDYQGYNVAMHELGHNVEQVFSLNGIDHWWLAGVPNNAFTEAFAFIFQERDLEMLGMAPPGGGQAAALATLWNTYEIAGVSLVDMRVWRWLYQHPEATAAELREAVLAIAREVWDRWFAPRLGHPGCEILAIYSHMIAYGLYLPDYALGHLAAFQLAARWHRPPAEPRAPGAGGSRPGQGAPGTPGPELDNALFGAEVERIARQGHLTPDAWMRGATGAPLSAAALLAAARRCLDEPDEVAAAS